MSATGRQAQRPHAADDRNGAGAVRRRLPLNSIRLRLLASLLFVLATMALVLGGITYRSVLKEAETLFDYQLQQIALSLRDQGGIAGEQAEALNNEALEFVVQIWSVDGRTVYPLRSKVALPSRAVLGFADIEAGGQTWRTFGVVAGERVIQVAQLLQVRSRLAAQSALRSVLPLLVLAPLLGALVWWLVASALAPLGRVALEVQGRDADSLAPVPAAGLPDEVAPLVESLNALLRRLGAAFEGQRAFVSDAAHELRSPLTALKLQIEVLQRSPDEASKAEALATLAAGVERARNLVEQMLTLARSEPGAQPVALEALDLSELARGALADTVPLAASRGTGIEFDGDPGATVQGDRKALHALVRNLADNAVRHSPPGARVMLRVARDGDQVTLTLDDSGPGIPAAERGRVFDRFWRREGAASEGSGLGLAIVRSVAERHRACISLDQSPLGGLRVQVRFRPAAAAPAPVS
jgi:signal transduction histidine kinase